MPEPIDKLWEQLKDVHYTALYADKLLERIAGRWRTFDVWANVGTAVFASGSAVAGWSLWQNPEYKFYWTVAAGAASLLSILHAALQVSSKIKTRDAEMRAFRGAYLQAESLRCSIERGLDFKEAERLFVPIQEALHKAQQDAAPIPAILWALPGKVQNSINAMWAFS